MPAFGKAGGGGRRNLSRERTSLSATLSTLSRIYQGFLSDLSAEGARVRGDQLPPPGLDVCVRVGGCKLFGVVRWSHEGQCGIEFFEPLCKFRLRELVGEFTRSGRVKAEVRAARDHWLNGRHR